MIGADILILLFGLGLAALTWLTGRAALEAARNSRRNNTILLGAATVALALVGLYAIADGMLRLFQP